MDANEFPIHNLTKSISSGFCPRFRFTFYESFSLLFEIMYLLRIVVVLVTLFITEPSYTTFVTHSLI